MINDYCLRFKPVHVGLRSIVWKGNCYVNDAGEEREEFALINDIGNLVYFTEKSGFDLKSRNLLFQYITDENTENAICLGTVEEFDLIEMEQLLSIDELSIFDSYYSSKQAIIKVDYSEHQYYYWINGDRQFFNGNHLYGYFSKNESILLNYIYRNKRPDFNFANYLLKKEEIKKYIDSLDINRFVDNYNKEKHIDTLMFDYINEEIEYNSKYIFPKILVWGK